MCKANGSTQLRSRDKIQLNDCIADYFKTETMDEDNKLTCDTCKEKTVHEMKFRVK